MKRKLISVKDAAEYLNVSKSSIWRLIAEGKLASVQVRSRRMVPFNRIYGLKPTTVYHMEKHVTQSDLDAIVFAGLPGPKRKVQCKKNSRGKFAPKYDWPEIERKKNLTPIEKLNEPLDFSKFDLMD
jgi:excisionase family DNA binding protein